MSLQLACSAIHRCCRVSSPLAVITEAFRHARFTRLSHPCNVQSLNGALRAYSSVALIGQPTHETHPHLIAPGEMTRGISKAEYKRRRDKLASAMMPNSVAVYFSAPEKIMSEDIPYESHHNVQVSYLSGFLEVNAIIVLHRPSEKKDYTYYMFVREKTAHRELWNGPCAGVDTMVPVFGCDKAYSTEKAKDILTPIFSKVYTIYTKAKVWPDMFKELKLDTLYDTKTREDGKILQEQMAVKSPAEIELMQTASNISGDSFAKAMAFTKPGMLESCIHAKIEFECKMSGAQRLAYPPVVAGGVNGLTLHYVQNTQLLRQGDLVLVDAGCEYHGYSSDITRTWPISKKFTPAQSEVYQVVLDCNKKCIEMAQAGVSISFLNGIATETLNDGLIKIGVLKRSSTNFLFSKIHPHNIGHYIGMDVHDGFNLTNHITLKPGMAITIEPGVYIPAHPSIPERFHNIAVRIEDNVVIQENGPPLVLTKNAPKEISHIEAIMQ